ncbi:MAG TPA: phospholipase [Leptospiraceae bacterium]|nr:phospholipase [Leptospiraceae bacterium]HNL70851.1 phospholipase [Leptospiraceae bacterium]
MKIYKIFMLPSLALLMSMFGLQAWTDHTLGTYPALASMPEVKNAKPVQVEAFEDFLTKESQGLAQLIKEQEEFARANIQNYPPKPDSIVFDPNDKKNIRKNFLMAMRLNPEVRLAYFIQELPGTNVSDKFPPENVSVYKNIEFLKRLNFKNLKVKSTVSALAVLATAADEPDYGHDIGLYEDNEVEPGKGIMTEHGKIYGFGKQPFGDKRFEYGSQAPFHMGFYHEAGIIYKFGGFIKRTLPEYRLHQFLTLARFAFKTGHPYWGYRFTGWGLHFVQDLTQPYHSTLVPGVGPSKLFFANAISMIGLSGAKNGLAKRVADRHTAIEHYQFEWFESIFRNKETDNKMLIAFSDMSQDSSYGEFDHDYIRNVLTKESNERASELDSRIENWEAILKFMDHNIKYEDVKDDSPAKQEIQEFLIILMKSFGSHTRNYLRAALKY